MNSDLAAMIPGSGTADADSDILRELHAVLALPLDIVAHLLSINLEIDLPVVCVERDLDFFPFAVRHDVIRIHFLLGNAVFVFEIRPFDTAMVLVSAYLASNIYETAHHCTGLALRK